MTLRELNGLVNEVGRLPAPFIDAGFRHRPDLYGLVYSPNDSEDEYSEWFPTLDDALKAARTSAEGGYFFYLVQNLPFDAEAIRTAYVSEVCQCGHQRGQHNYDCLGCFECACVSFEAPPATTA